MSRIIKDFGPINFLNKSSNDHLTLTAEEVSRIDTPTIKFKVSKDFREGELTFNVNLSASETEPGIKIVISGINNNFFCEHISDEEIFADVLFETVSQGKTGASSEVLKSLYTSIFSTHILPQIVKDGFWFFDVASNQWTNTL